MSRAKYPKFWVSEEAPIPYYYLLVIQERSVLRLLVKREDFERLKNDLTRIQKAVGVKVES